MEADEKAIWIARRLLGFIALRELLSVVAVAGLGRVPAVVVNDTTSPAADPDATVTVARKLTALNPSAATLDGLATTPIPVTKALVTVTAALPTVPFAVRTWTASGVFRAVGLVPV